MPACWNCLALPTSLLIDDAAVTWWGRQVGEVLPHVRHPRPSPAHAEPH